MAAEQPTRPKVLENVEAVLALEEKYERALTKHQVVIERTTAALARPLTTYAIAAAVVGWTVLNMGARPIDPPPFFWLQGVAGVCALLMTTLVLTTQRIQGLRVEQRAHLDLQVNLLAEQKIAKLIALVEELRRDLPSVDDRQDLDAEAMMHAVDPHEVADVFEKSGHAGDDRDKGKA